MAQIFKKRKGPNKIIHAFLRLSYLYDNTNIDTLNELFSIKNSLESNSFTKETNEILNLNEPIIQKDKNYYLEKIFKLIEVLSEYNIKDIINKYNIGQYILKCNQLNKFANNFNNDISPGNTGLYFFTLYYNWLLKLFQLFEKSNKESLKAKDENYIDENLEKKMKTLTTLEGIMKEMRQKIVELLNIKTEVDKLDEESFETIVYIAKNKEIDKEYNKYNDPKYNEIEELLSDLRIKEQIFKNLDSYFNYFYQNYLINLKGFLKRINNTKQYIKELDYTNKKNLKILTNFIFFLTYYDFSKIHQYVDYYEKTFEKVDFSNDENFKIKDGKLFVEDIEKEIDNYNDYNLAFINNKFEDLEKNRFLREKYLKFNYFPEKNLFNKYIKLNLKFFKDLFLNDNSCIKKLFIKVFPVLKSNYFIDEKFLEYIFYNKIFTFNFESSELVGITEHSNLNIILKDNYTGNKDISSNEICVFAAFIIILFHELANFISVYILKHLKVVEFDNSLYFKKNENTDIGRIIEIKLFGRVIEKMNVIEAIYILNINNYLKNNVEDFLKGFMNLKNEKKIFIDDNVKQFLNEINIYNVNFDLTDIKNIFFVKGNSNRFNIGVNNDKCCTLKEIERVHKSLLEQYKDVKRK